MNRGTVVSLLMILAATAGGCASPGEGGATPPDGKQAEKVHRVRKLWYTTLAKFRPTTKSGDRTKNTNNKDFEVDVGTFTARMGGNPGDTANAYVWRAPNHPEVEVWALWKQDDVGYARPSASTSANLEVTRVPDPGWDYDGSNQTSAPDDDANVKKFAQWAAKQHSNDAVGNFSVYRLTEVSSVPPNSTPTSGYGCLRAGLFQVVETDHPTPGERAEVVAWAWHPNDSDDYEVWCYRAPVNSESGYYYPGAHLPSSTDPYSPATLSISGQSTPPSIIDVDSFITWVFTNGNAVIAVRQKIVKIERVQVP